MRRSFFAHPLHLARHVGRLSLAILALALRCIIDFSGARVLQHLAFTTEEKVARISTDFVELARPQVGDSATTALARLLESVFVLST